MSWNREKDIHMIKEMACKGIFESIYLNVNVEVGKNEPYDRI